VVPSAGVAGQRAIERLGKAHRTGVTVRTCALFGDKIQTPIGLDDVRMMHQRSDTAPSDSAIDPHPMSNARLPR